MSEVKTKKVLIADDDDEVRAIVRDSIAALGHECLLASDGQQAKDIFLKGTPDVAVLDYMMPNASGPDLVKWIRSLDGGEMVPILVLTAKVDIKDKVETLDLGADDYLTKPFNYKELQARVNALLRVRDLNLKLHLKNVELQNIQEKLIEKERQILANELAGTTAHAIGQPVSAIMLNCHLLEVLPKEDPKFVSALLAVKDDIRRIAEILNKLKKVDASSKSNYFAESKILDIEKSK